MPTYREDLHLGHKVPQIETDDISNGAVTIEKIDPEFIDYILSEACHCGYICEIVSSAGTSFRNGEVNTILTVLVRHGDVDITEQLTNAIVEWSRYTGWDEENLQFIQTAEDLQWVATPATQPNSIRVTTSDMGSGWMVDYRRAMFRCTVKTENGEMYKASFITGN